MSVEVGQLYPKELAFGKKAIRVINERFDSDLPEDEATPLALHLVNSQFATADLVKTFKMTEVFAQIFEIISSAYGYQVNQSHLSVARFVTHLRYLFVRAEQGKATRAQDAAFPAVQDAVRRGYPRAYDCAHKVSLLLQMHMDQELTEDEHTYLTMHIARLATDLWGESSSAHHAS